MERNRAANWFVLFGIDRAQIAVFACAFAARVIYAVVILIVAGERGFLAFSDAKAFYYKAAVNLIVSGPTLTAAYGCLAA
jgi:hypothetical protein